MKKTVALLALLLVGIAGSVDAQGFESEPVFKVKLVADRTPLVAGDDLRLAVVVTVADGWHVNSDEPGDEFSLPTTVEFILPGGWPVPVISFPDGEALDFEFSETPIEVWEHQVVIQAGLVVPDTAVGDHRLRVAVTAQACNNTQCLAPEEVRTGIDVTVAPPGSSSKRANEELFAVVVDSAGERSDLGSKSLPLLLIGIFLAGLALNLTPCVFPLIPITVGFFTQQTKDREGSAFPLALAYVVGIALTYSVLGMLAALSGAIFGSALQSPWVVGLIVVVLLALAASMFGLWELRVPGWAQRASGGRSGVFGAFIMGLVMGFVAAPCIGPFVVGLLTYVGQKGDPVLGFILFFTLALGLGLPYLILGTFTGAVNKLPASGMWMVGVRRVFGVILVAMAAYFAAPLMPGDSGRWLMSAVLVFGALYLLVIDRTGHEQPTIDRVMRLLSAIMLVSGVLVAPIVHIGGGATAASAEHMTWQAYDGPALHAAVDAGGPVIVDFYADWCAPCRELDEKTFAAQKVSAELEGFTRFKVDLTRSSEETQDLAIEYGVAGVPTVIVFSGGEEVFRITGFEPPAQFLKRLQAVP
ncbi:MAG: thioredoxin fold domain-containing protein [Acidobacteria bacterium]|nr:thioredoxin fold domain-containing protein [Acidobacteriota bacterium]